MRKIIYIIFSSGVFIVNNSEEPKILPHFNTAN